MKGSIKRIIVFSFILSLAVIDYSFARMSEITSRKATAIDSTGTKTEVEKVSIDSDWLGPFSIFKKIEHDSCPAERTAVGIQVMSNIFAAIPMNNVHKIARDGEKVVVEYSWRDVKRKVEGDMLPFEFVFDTAFGKVRIPSDKLASLTFADNTTVIEKKTKNGRLRDEFKPYNCKMTLSTGTTIEAALFGRIHVIRESSIYIGRGRYSEIKYSNIKFKMGDSVVTTDLDKIKKIEMDESGDVIVSLRSGQSTSGKPEDLYAFIGIGDYGRFFVLPKNVRSIVFTDTITKSNP